MATEIPICRSSEARSLRRQVAGGEQEVCTRSVA